MPPSTFAFTAGISTTVAPGSRKGDPIVACSAHMAGTRTTVQNIEDWAKPVLLAAVLASLGWIFVKVYNAFKDTPERGRLCSELEQRKRDVRAANIGALWHELKAMRDWYHRNASELDKQDNNRNFYVQWLSKEWLSWSENPTPHDAWPTHELEQLYRDIDKMKV